MKEKSHGPEYLSIDMGLGTGADHLSSPPPGPWMKDRFLFMRGVPVFTKEEQKILRSLAMQVRDISLLPEMEERRCMWMRHHRLERVRPLVLIYPEGSWQELLPMSSLECTGEQPRMIERELKSRIYHHLNFHDDKPIEGSFVVSKVIRNTGWGLTPRYKASPEKRGAWTFDPIILDESDLEKLQNPRVEYLEEESLASFEMIRNLLGDLLDVRLEGIQHISFHMMSDYCRLRGLKQVMMDMYDHANLIHRVMAFFTEGNLDVIHQLEQQNLFSLNNHETYHSSGGLGYTDLLPASSFDPKKVRPIDLWASAESQEMAGVSPAMHREFALDYEIQLLERFGLNGYGCCENLTKKLDDVLRIPRIRRISIAPEADVGVCAEILGKKAIFSWKPQPSHLVGTFDEDAIRKYIRDALKKTRDCVAEVILKDTHTCENRPERFTRWSQIVKQLVEQF